MRTCLIHIGMMKTGSTAIQNAFKGYSSDSLKYARSERINHTGLLRDAIVTDGPPRLANAGKGMSDEQLEATAKRSMKKLINELSTGEHDLLLSSEELTTTFKKRHVDELCGLVNEHFDRIKVIAYVREPIGYMRSMFQQRLKMRADVGFDYDGLFPKYRRFFQKWVDAVGGDNVELVPYDDRVVKGDGIVSDFAGRVGVDPHQLKTVDIRANESLSAEAAAVLYSYRSQRGGPRDHQWMAKRNGFVTSKLSNFGSLPYDLDRADCRAAVERRRGVCEWIEGLMGERLPAETPAKPEAIQFTNHEVIRHFASLQVPALEEFVAETLRREVPSGLDEIGLLDVMYRSS